MQLPKRTPDICLTKQARVQTGVSLPRVCCGNGSVLVVEEGEEGEEVEEEGKGDGEGWNGRRGGGTDAF